MKTCPYCDVEFQRKRKDQKYCSKDCYTEAGRVRNREKYWLDGKDNKYASWSKDVTRKEYDVWHTYGL